MSNLFFDIGDLVDVTVNGEKSKARVIGFEMAWWLKPQDWLYKILIDQYSFTLSVTQSCLFEGANIWTNGRTARIQNEKDKAK